MDSLQTLACHSFLAHSSIGTEVPHDKGMRQKCVARLVDDGILDAEFEL